MFGSSLILFNLANGAELIGNLVEETPESYIIEYPVVIRPVQKSETEVGIQFYPHSMTNPEGTHTFFKPILSRSLEIPDELEKGYTRHVSKIAIVSTLNGWERGAK